MVSWEQGLPCRWAVGTTTAFLPLAGFREVDPPNPHHGPQETPIGRMGGLGEEQAAAQTGAEPQISLEIASAGLMMTSPLRTRHQGAGGDLGMGPGPKDC